MQVVFDKCMRCEKVKSGFSFLAKPEAKGERLETIICLSCIQQLLEKEKDSK